MNTNRISRKDFLRLDTIRDKSYDEFISPAEQEFSALFHAKPDDIKSEFSTTTYASGSSVSQDEKMQNGEILARMWGQR